VDPEQHVVAHVIHVPAHDCHVACDGWNKVVMKSAKSWEDGKDPGEACRSCGGMEANRFWLKENRS
jgi:hypothetical protein